MAPGDVLATYADVQRASERIGYAPQTSIDEGLRRFVRWYKSPAFRVSLQGGQDTGLSHRV
jgi:nucleoside-diphosphate-sugar epimerase